MFWFLMRYWTERPTLSETGERRAYEALEHVLPRSAEVRRSGNHVVVNGHPLNIQWIGRGWLADAQAVLAASGELPLVAVARRMSPGARKALAEASIGWVDETGAAEIATGPLVVSKSGRPVGREQRTTDWTPAVFAVAEALLCGARATVAGTERTTGLSTGSRTNALRFLTEKELLVSDARRGRHSARRVAEFDRLLQAYAGAVAESDPAVVVQVGVTWRDLPSGLARIGKEWRIREWRWSCTGAVAASVLAPYLTSVGIADVYVSAETIAGLEAAAADVGLRPIDGGRLHLRPFPTVAVPRLSTETKGLRVAPWPRVYADLRLTGVRGEEAAEHLWKVIHGG